MLCKVTHCPRHISANTRHTCENGTWSPVVMLFQHPLQQTTCSGSTTICYLNWILSQWYIDWQLWLYIWINVPYKSLPMQLYVLVSVLNTLFSPCAFWKLFIKTKTPIRLGIQLMHRYCTCFVSVRANLCYWHHNHISSYLLWELQISMNALKTIIGVILMQLATTMKGVTLALARLDTQAMDLFVQVSYLSMAYLFIYFNLLLMQIIFIDLELAHDFTV